MTSIGHVPDAQRCACRAPRELLGAVTDAQFLLMLLSSNHGPVCVTYATSKRVLAHRETERKNRTAAAAAEADR